MKRFLPTLLLAASTMLAGTVPGNAEPILEQNFDAIPAGYSGSYGAKTAAGDEPVGGRWSSFGTDSVLPEIVAGVSPSGQCVRVQRTGGDPSQHLVATILPVYGHKIRWTFRVNPSEDGEALVNLHRKNIPLCGLYLSGKGIRYWSPEPDGNGKNWVPVEARLDANQWNEVELLLDLDQRTYSGRIITPRGETLLFEQKPLSRALDGPASVLVISPQAGGPVYFDDIRLVLLDEP